MLKEPLSGNHDQGHCTVHGIYLMLSFLICFGKKLAMELNILIHIINAYQPTQEKHT